MNTVPTTLTSKIRTPGAGIGAIGDADTLHHAFEADQLVTLDGKYAGERVYLGYRHQVMVDDAVTVERVGLDQELGESPKFPGHTIAVYLVDTTRLDEAPRLAALVQAAEAKRTARLAEQAARVHAEDERLEREAD